MHIDSIYIAHKYIQNSQMNIYALIQPLNKNNSIRENFMSSKLPSILVLSFLALSQIGCKSETETAAEQGQALAQFRLGKMYHQGDDKEKDMIYAYMWVNLAKTQGLGETASNYLDEISKDMSDEDILHAESLSTKCKNKGYKDC